MSWPWWLCPLRAAPKPCPIVCAPETGKTIDPGGAVVGAGVVVVPGAPTPPLCAKASPEPSTADATAATASAATTLRGVRRTGCSDPASTMLSAACGVSCRARAESGATNQSVAIRPWGLIPFGSPARPGVPGGFGHRLARQYNERTGAKPRSSRKPTFGAERPLLDVAGLLQVLRRDIGRVLLVDVDPCVQLLHHGKG